MRSRGVDASNVYGTMLHIASSRGIFARAAIADATSGAARTAARPPQLVQPSTSAHPLRVPEHELLRDVTAHRHPDDVRGGDAGGVEHRHSIIGHQRNRVLSGRDVALADAAVVEHDRPVAWGQRRHQAVPPFERGAEAHDEQQGIAFAMLLPPDASARVRRVRHGLSVGQPRVLRQRIHTEKQRSRDQRALFVRSSPK